MSAKKRAVGKPKPREKSKAGGKPRRKSVIEKASKIVSMLDVANACDPTGKTGALVEAIETANAAAESVLAGYASQLTAKEARFVEEYLVDLNATQAAIRAGYSEKTARQIGSENLSKPYIVDAIAKAMAARSERTRVSQDRVITGIAELAFYDIADLFDEKGSLRSIHELSPMLRRAVAGIEVRELYNDDGKNIGRLSKVKLADRKGNLELLGRHLKLFTDKVEHEAGASLEQILARSMTTAPKEG